MPSGSQRSSFKCPGFANHRLGMVKRVALSQGLLHSLALRLMVSIRISSRASRNIWFQQYVKSAWSWTKLRLIVHCHIFLTRALSIPSPSSRWWFCPFESITGTLIWGLKSINLPQATAYSPSMCIVNLIRYCHMGGQDPCKFVVDYFTAYSMSH